VCPASSMASFSVSGRSALGRAVASMPQLQLRDPASHRCRPQAAAAGHHSDRTRSMEHPAV
jgi:hypothetical protein